MTAANVDSATLSARPPASAQAPASPVAGLTWEVVRALEAVGLDAVDVARVVRAALDEDFRYGADVTSAATVAGRTVTADVVAREPGVVAGLPVALAVLDLLADYPCDGAGDDREPASARCGILRALIGALCIPHHRMRGCGGPGKARRRRRPGRGRGPR